MVHCKLSVITKACLLCKIRPVSQSLKSHCNVVRALSSAFLICLENFVKLNRVHQLILHLLVGTVENHGKNGKKTRRTFVKIAKITAVYIAANLLICMVFNSKIYIF